MVLLDHLLQIQIQMSSENISQNAGFLFLSTSSTSIKTNGADIATISASVLDENRVPIEGALVSFETTGGQISSSSALTDVDGVASVEFSSGNDKTNALVTISAAVQNLSGNIPIQVTGTIVGLDIDTTSFQEDVQQQTLTVSITDAGDIPIYNALVQTSLNNTGIVELSPETGYTDVNGNLDILVTGNNSGDAILSVSALGYTKELDFTVSGDPFEFVQPLTDSISENTESIISVQVRSPEGHNVKFATTMGSWNPMAIEADDVVVSVDDETIIVIEPGENDFATAELHTGALSGVATIRAEDSTDVDINDTISVAISASSDEAAKISLQVAPSVIAPSTGDLSNITTLNATVRNSADQIVAGAPVMFSLFKTTGGGENINPPVVYTDDIGEAQATFTSGARVSDTRGVFCLGRIAGASVAGPDSVFGFLETNPDTIVRSTGSFINDGFNIGDTIRVSGSSSNDNTFTIDNITATTLTLGAEDDLVEEAAGASLVIGTSEDTDVVAVVIAGVASSIAIGGAAVIEELNSSTYNYPMSVLVADSNGNPVAGSTVNLSVWPTWYYTGVTVENVGPVPTFVYPNEDLNRNSILDSGEDTHGHPAGSDLTSGNGQIDPAKSTAGTVPATVTTDENGVAQFDYIYQKNYAGWLDVEIKATALVYGSETSSAINFALGWLDDEKSNIPNSPWGVGPADEEPLPGSISLNTGLDKHSSSMAQAPRHSQLVSWTLLGHPMPRGTTIEFVTSLGVFSNGSDTMVVGNP